MLKSQSTAGTVADFLTEILLWKYQEGCCIDCFLFGYDSQDVKVDGRSMIVVVLREDSEMLEEVVVVGYDSRKGFVVGAITQTQCALERAAVELVAGAALTGNLPGVVTNAGTGMLRRRSQDYNCGASSWNNNEEPSVLVDGIERPMSSVDITSVQSISVLKDASQQQYMV